MTDEPSPRPWRVDEYDARYVRDSDGRFIARADAADAALIVATVNERDRLRDELDVERSQHYTDIEQAEYHAEHHRKILEAERDRLRDLVRRLVGYCDAVTVYRPTVVEVRGSDGTHEDYNGAELLREARAVINADGDRLPRVGIIIEATPDELAALPFNPVYAEVEVRPARGGGGNQRREGAGA